ncbi:hypothetical protein EDD21DRAFT_449052 [Dissophora ornata]|nr:hypothetical protein EDD21DRAFT_449052 [Dissophora ornata]
MSRVQSESGKWLKAPINHVVRRKASRVDVLDDRSFTKRLLKTSRLQDISQEMSNLTYFLVIRNMASNKGLGLQVNDDKYVAINQTADVSRLPVILALLGVLQTLAPARGQMTVAVQSDDGKVGYCSAEETERVVDALRHYNVSGAHVGAVLLDIELSYVRIPHGGQYPGL